ncbi:Uncharacterized protein HZ326_20093 [Fusarium oxysporum f. sp. albedinis]|nr:Uncharacterized protein HZ326_20093 [Fusarium oxysporum f. sp. albedinis]
MDESPCVLIPVSYRSTAALGDCLLATPLTTPKKTRLSAPLPKWLTTFIVLRPARTLFDCCFSNRQIHGQGRADDTRARYLQH